MIESVSLSNTTTFKGEPQLLGSLSQFNYFFGSNGIGETTISRLIADESSLPHCTILWTRNTPIVINQDFFENNLNQNILLKGVFTFGEQQVGALEMIEAF